jgi:hypothetical protein
LDNTDRNGATATDRLNYFNYFTEVEEEFVRRRGKPLLVSPLDWALIESWKTSGIPLHIVLRAINRAFDAYDARPRKFRKVNSVFYCQQEVESSFAEYRLSQVGGDLPEVAGQPSQKHRKKSKDVEPETDTFPKPVLLEFFARSDAELHAAGALAATLGRMEVEHAIERARARLLEIKREVETAMRVDAEAIEHDLDGLDRIMLDGATKSCGEDKMAEIRTDAEKQLAPFRKKMDKAIYEQTVRNFIARRLREMNNLPRLSLFYL